MFIKSAEVICLFTIFIRVKPLTGFVKYEFRAGFINDSVFFFAFARSIKKGQYQKGENNFGKSFSTVIHMGGFSTNVSISFIILL